MEIRHTAYIINRSAYLYIMDYEDTYDYTFYNDHYLVMETGNIDKGDLDLDGAMRSICTDHHIKPEGAYLLSEEQMQEMIHHIDDYEYVKVL